VLKPKAVSPIQKSRNAKPSGLVLGQKTGLTRENGQIPRKLVRKKVGEEDKENSISIVRRTTNGITTLNNEAAKPNPKKGKGVALKPYVQKGRTPLKELDLNEIMDLIALDATSSMEVTVLDLV
jgi:hypothetical protein